MSNYNKIDHESLQELLLKYKRHEGKNRRWSNWYRDQIYSILKEQLIKVVRFQLNRWDKPESDSNILSFSYESFLLGLRNWDKKKSVIPKDGSLGGHWVKTAKYFLLKHYFSYDRKVIVERLPISDKDTHSSVLDYFGDLEELIIDSRGNNPEKLLNIVIELMDFRDSLSIPYQNIFDDVMLQPMKENANMNHKNVKRLMEEVIRYIIGG